MGKSYLINIKDTDKNFQSLFCHTRKGSVIKNAALVIPTTRDSVIAKLHDKMRCNLHLIYSKLEEVIIGDRSLVSDISLYQTEFPLMKYLVVV